MHLPSSSFSGNRDPWIHEPGAFAETLRYQRSSTSGTVAVKKGCIMLAEEEYIAHICDCVTAGPAQGIASAIFHKYPQADVYQQRFMANRRRDPPGTASVHGRIINLYSQLLSGLPADDEHPPDSLTYTLLGVCPSQDTRQARIQYFRLALASLTGLLPARKSLSLAIPRRVGCGKDRGGWWPHYFGEVCILAQSCPGWRITIYDGDPGPWTPLAKTISQTLPLAEEQGQLQAYRTCHRCGLLNRPRTTDCSQRRHMHNPSYTINAASRPPLDRCTNHIQPYAQPMTHRPSESDTASSQADRQLEDGSNDQGRCQRMQPQ